MGLHSSINAVIDWIIQWMCLISQGREFQTDTALAQEKERNILVLTINVWNA